MASFALPHLSTPPWPALRCRGGTDQSALPHWDPPRPRYPAGAHYQCQAHAVAAGGGRTPPPPPRVDTGRQLWHV